MATVLAQLTAMDDSGESARTLVPQAFGYTQGEHDPQPRFALTIHVR